MEAPGGYDKRDARLQRELGLSQSGIYVICLEVGLKVSDKVVIN